MMVHPPLSGTSLIADPVHTYIHFTVPLEPEDPIERTEKDLIDSPWMQRLRYIYQLQSARWVYPSAEHSRFQHSLGAMHVAGRFANHLYPTLAETVPDVPSQPFIEELLRITALVHDIGHGPFCHFFDHHFLKDFNLTHEHIGQHLVREILRPIIERLRRSPSGRFDAGEKLNADHIAFLILKDPQKESHPYPRWLQLLQPLIGGLFTADNFDYVLRDSYMCGVAVGPVDITRLIHYTLITPQGLAIHKTGLSALQMFLNTRMYLYSNVYFHRTTRAIDLHLLDIFHDTMQHLFPYHPLKKLDTYLGLTDWSLLEEVRTWSKVRRGKRQTLGREWDLILKRQVKWKMAYNASFPFNETSLFQMKNPSTVEARIRHFLPKSLKKITFRVDIASKDTRPINLLNMGQFQIYVYDPSTQTIGKETLRKLFEYLPVRIMQFRIFAENHENDAELSTAAEKALQ